MHCRGLSLEVYRSLEDSQESKTRTPYPRLARLGEPSLLFWDRHDADSMRNVVAKIMTSFKANLVLHQIQHLARHQRHTKATIAQSDPNISAACLLPSTALHRCNIQTLARPRLKERSSYILSCILLASSSTKQDSSGQFQRLAALLPTKSDSCAATRSGELHHRA